MKTTSLLPVLLALFATTLPITSLAQAAPTEKNAAPDIDLALTWHQNATAQFVFFSVLEGCYRDGLPVEAAKLIANPDADKPVKRFFVFRCELCHASYEAFRAYAATPGFTHIKDAADFGGKKLDAKTLKQLESDNVIDRVFAMGNLVRPWIQERADRQKLDAAEREKLKQSFKKFAGEGDKLMRKYRVNDPAYFDWTFYGTCQACEAARDFK